MLDWLRWQRMAILEPVAGHEVLMVHAGVLPTWTATQTVSLATEVESVLRSAALGEFLMQMYDNQPDHWDEALTGIDRLRVIVNALTRLRFCTPSGQMEFSATGGADTAPVGYLPWFDVPGRQTSGVMLAFGHWSTLGWLGRTNVLALDSGCVWGGSLSALRLEAVHGQLQQQLIQVKCQQAQKPG